MNELWSQDFSNLPKPFHVLYINYFIKYIFFLFRYKNEINRLNLTTIKKIHT